MHLGIRGKNWEFSFNGLNKFEFYALIEVFLLDSKFRKSLEIKHFKNFDR